MLTTTTTIKNMIEKAKKSVLTKSGKRIGLFFPSGNQSIVQAWFLMNLCHVFNEKEENKDSKSET